MDSTNWTKYRIITLDLYLFFTLHSYLLTNFCFVAMEGLGADIISAKFGSISY